jgi:hypothetical protein
VLPGTGGDWAGVASRGASVNQSRMVGPNRATTPTTTSAAIDTEMTTSGQRERSPTARPFADMDPTVPDSRAAGDRAPVPAGLNRGFSLPSKPGNMTAMRIAHALRAVPALACALVLAAPALAHAGPRETYIFLLSRVDLGKKGAPPALEQQVTSELAKQIAGHKDLDGALPADAPDPEARPEPFKAFLKKRKQRAFKVNVEITDFESGSEARDGRSNLLTVRIALRLFGETVPDRVMAFTGDGSATVKVEYGKTLREADSKYAYQQALELAVADALKTSIARLREPPPTQQKKKKK